MKILEPDELASLREAVTGHTELDAATFSSDEIDVLTRVLECSARAQLWVAAQAAVNKNGSANIAIEDHVTSEGVGNKIDDDNDKPSHLSRPM